MSGGAPQNPRLTVDDVMALGADQYSHILNMYGNTPYGRAQAEQLLRRTYPTADNTAIRAALDRMGEARDAANRINRRTAAGALPRDAYPVDPTIRRYPVPTVDPALLGNAPVPPGVNVLGGNQRETAYAYRVRVDYWYQGDRRSLIVHVASTSNLDLRQIRERVNGMAQPWLDAHYADYDDKPSLVQPGTAAGPLVMSVEFAYRRTR